MFFLFRGSLPPNFLIGEFLINEIDRKGFEGLVPEMQMLEMFLSFLLMLQAQVILGQVIER